MRKTMIALASALTLGSTVLSTSAFAFGHLGGLIAGGHLGGLLRGGHLGGGVLGGGHFGGGHFGGGAFGGHSRGGFGGSHFGGRPYYGIYSGGGDYGGYAYDEPDSDGYADGDTGRYYTESGGHPRQLARRATHHVEAHRGRR
jgi:hypothetical protein